MDLKITQRKTQNAALNVDLFQISFKVATQKEKGCLLNKLGLNMPKKTEQRLQMSKTIRGKYS